ncbi:P-loop containing nucleoside triphosphate hydrolase protein [Obelidium mucronatum]|nr:P-loop containing nucleoside triphosphate hydrolase protein [Obelidium mucronatum]
MSTQDQDDMDAGFALTDLPESEPTLGEASSVRHESDATLDVSNDAGVATPRRKHRKSRRDRNVLDLLLFLWGFRLLSLVRSADDVLAIHLHLKSHESAKIAAEKLEAAWAKDSSKKLWRSLQTAFGNSYALLGIWKLLWAAAKWIGSYAILKWLLEFVEERNEGKDPSAWRGHVIALALLLSAVISSICYHQLSMQSTKIGIRCRAALMVLIYRKSLRLSYVKGGVGDIVNLIANECNRVAEATVNWHFLWSSIAESIIIITLVFADVGFVSGIPALVMITFVLLPVQYYIANRISEISIQSTAHITKRVHLVSEVLTAIKLLKFYAWESYYVDKIMNARVVEMQELWLSLRMRILSYVGCFHGPGWMSASVVFALFSLFNTLRYPLISLPKSVRTVNGRDFFFVFLTAATSSLHRLEEFLNQPEIDETISSPTPEGTNILIDIRNADFLWDGDLDHPHITDLTLTIRRGEIIAVVGDLSSGKSLLAAIMGQINRSTGTMHTHGTCGYVPQEPWLIDANIRDNILFGLDFDDQKYTDTIRLVGLTRDLMLMSNGDESRISDLNLSASQKQRLSLARCIYHDCDVILLEDCLSDFEQGNARRMFKECFRNNLLKTKAIVLVTQQKQFLKDCDRILVLKNGRVIEDGTFTELKEKKVNFSAWVNDFVVHEANELTIRAIMELNNGSIQNAQVNEQTISKLIERNQLSVLTGGASRPPANFSNQDPVSRTIEANQLTVHSMVGFEKTMTDRAIVLRTEAGPWQSYAHYLNEGNGVLFGVGLVVPVFHSLVVVAVVGLFLRGYIFSIMTVKKSRSLHDRALKAIVRAPMSFFDSTPLGQILANFARHLYLIDDSLPESLFQVLSIAPLVLGILILVSAIVPWFILTLPVTIGLGYYVISICHDAEKRLVMLEASNKSPMFSHLSTTLEGLFSIRLYNAQDSFDTFNRGLIDADHKALYSLNVVKTVQAMYLDFTSSLMIYFAALFVVLRTDIPASHAGLAIANVLQLLLFVQWLARLCSNVHQAVTSVGTVVQFSNQVPCEAVRHVPGGSKRRPFWPETGAVEFKQVTLRYTQYGVAILKNVSFKIAAGEKIGIVGRSGSGKSTILVALLRITEYNDGDILIDGIDIKTLGVADLRSRIAVIPQDPVLLTGTIRSNLDPFNKRTDEEIYQALKAVHLGQKIEEMPAKLDTLIVENGRAFSLAERQLFCIARAILLKTKIVVFDEPTVAADNETDTLIQSTISENFVDSTVIILASRFRMIAETDRIMVMKDGKIVEFDTPLALLDNPKSKFRLMLNQATDLDQGKLRRAAKQQEKEKAAAERKISFGGLSESTSSGSLSSSGLGNGGMGPSDENGSAPSTQEKANIQMPKSLLDIFGPK